MFLKLVHARDKRKPSAGQKKARAAAQMGASPNPKKKENEVSVKHFASQKLRFRPKTITLA